MRAPVPSTESSSRSDDEVGEDEPPYEPPSGFGWHGLLQTELHSLKRVMQRGLCRDVIDDVGTVDSGATRLLHEEQREGSARQEDIQHEDAPMPAHRERNERRDHDVGGQRSQREHRDAYKECRAEGIGPSRAPEVDPSAREMRVPRPDQRKEQHAPHQRELRHDRNENEVREVVTARRTHVSTSYAAASDRSH